MLAVLVIFIFLLIFLVFIFQWFNKHKYHKYDFVSILNSKSIYNVNSKIYDIEDDKYIIFGVFDRKKFNNRKYNSFSPIGKSVYVEIYDNKKKKIKKVTKDLFYQLFNVKNVQIDKENLLIIFSEIDYVNNKYPSYFGIFNLKDYSIKNIGNCIEKIGFVPELLSISNNKIFLFGYKKTAIFDGKTNSIILGPEFNLKRIRAKAIELENDKILIVGDDTLEKGTLNIEICDLKENKCKISNAKLNQPKRFPPMFKNKDGNILIFPDVIKKDYLIELYNVEKDEIEVVANIDKYYNFDDLKTEKTNDNYWITGVMGANFVQLQDGNILITGGYSGISMPTINKEVFIFDINNNKLIRLKDAKHERFNHTTKVLNDGNVLFLGFNQKQVELFITK